MKNIIEQVRNELSNNIDEMTLQTHQHFFKEKSIYALKSTVNRSVTIFLVVLILKPEQSIDLCETLCSPDTGGVVYCLQWSYAINHI
jgi:hypothetical protein